MRYISHFLVIVFCLGAYGQAVLAADGGDADDQGFAADQRAGAALVAGAGGDSISFAPKGIWTFQAYGSATFSGEAGGLFLAHLGGGYHFKDDLSINLELIAGSISFDAGFDDSASVVGVDMLLRYHFFKLGNWTFYSDGGFGLQQSSRPFPLAGTHFNFRSQAGMGFTLKLNDQARFMAGARWVHVSNADKDGSDLNPGYDGAMVYSGLLFTF